MAFILTFIWLQILKILILADTWTYFFSSCVQSTYWAARTSSGYQYFTHCFWVHQRELVRVCMHLPFSICICFCTSTYTAKLSCVLLCCALCWEAHCPFQRCIQKHGWFFFLFFWGGLCVQCQWGMGRSAKQHDSGFDKHWLVRWNGCAPRWPPWVVCTNLAALALSHHSLGPQCKMVHFTGSRSALICLDQQLLTAV